MFPQATYPGFLLADGWPDSRFPASSTVEPAFTEGPRHRAVGDTQ